MITQVISKSRCLAALTLVAALAGFSGCVSMDEYKKLDTAFQQAKAQLAESENDLANMRAEIDSLKAQIARNEGISGGVVALKSENDLLKAKLAELQAKYDDLIKHVGEIQMPEEANDALMKLAEQYPDLLEYDPKLGRIRIKSDLTFDLGSTEVKPRVREALGKLASILDLDVIANNQIRIVGHTDDVPIRTNGALTLNPNNWFLSTNRAHAVREVLQGDGVQDKRIQAAGDGPTEPIADNAPGHKGNAMNRRVEIYILPTLVPAGAIEAPESDSKDVASGPRSATVSHRPSGHGSGRGTTHTPATAPAPAPLVPVPGTLPGGGVG